MEKEDVYTSCSAVAAYYNECFKLVLGVVVADVGCDVVVKLSTFKIKYIFKVYLKKRS